MENLVGIFEYEWFIRALIASSLVGVMCGVLGCFIVLRNMALIGDGLAHAILPGIVVAFLVLGYSTLGFFTGAVIAGLLTAIAITWIQHNVKTKNDAAIGIVSTAMLSIGVIGISKISKNEGVHLDLKDFLFGNILGISDQDIYLTIGIAIYVIISIIVFYRYLFVSTFQPVIAETMGISVKAIHYLLMLLLSFAVVASLRTVGVILVVAMLITPASTAILLSDRLKTVLWLSALIGLATTVLGLFTAIWMDTTPGPAMVLTATAIYLMVVLFAPKKGLISKFFQKRKLQNRIQLEDTLKQSLKLTQRKELDLPSLLNRLGMKKGLVIKHLQNLKSQNLMNVNGNEVALTQSGMEKATKLVRAHRLWESFLVTEMGLTEEQIHEDAEKYEHLLTDEILDEVDAKLGFPETDPHGSPIPLKNKLLKETLFHLPLKKIAFIAKNQTSDHIQSELWQLGLLPEEEFSVFKKGPQYIELMQDEKNIKVSTRLAKKIAISHID